MSDWTAGYMADIGYTYGYYTELNPQRVHLAFLNAGLVPPVIGAACELGFGQGMSANLHAAASVVRWTGPDFNPSQASFAQELARVADAGAELFDEAFEEFCRRDDLPEFDYIGLHGIWSWVSDANRTVIVDFIRRKLKVGGVLFISYNTQPGWASMVPMRELLTEHAEVLGSDGVGIVSRIESSLAFAEQLLAVNPKFARANPQVAERLKQIKNQDRHYVAHEYFNHDWQPMSFGKMAQWLKEAKVQWACSARYLDAIDAINLTTEQQQLLAAIPDPMFRETTRDFCVNQYFRKDYWVKGIRRLSGLEQTERLRTQRVILVKPRAEVELKVTGHAGEATLQAGMYAPVLDLLADHKPRTLGEMEQSVAAQGVNFAALVQAVMVLTAMGALMPVQEEAVMAMAKKHTDRLNAYLMSKARSNPALQYLASPVTGGGIAMDQFEQFFLRARQLGHKEPQDCAAFAWNLLESQGQFLMKDGKKLATSQENLAEMVSIAHLFAEKRLPILKALQLA